MDTGGPILFDAITLFILALTLATAAWRFRAGLTSRWPLVYWTVVAAYSLVLNYTLSRWWVFAGIVCAVLLRAHIGWRQARVAEMVALAYVAYRSVGLLLDWPMLFFDW